MAPDARPFAPAEESTIDSFTVANDGLLLSIPIWSIEERGQLSLSFTLRFTPPSYQETQVCLPQITPCNEDWEATSSLNGVYLTSNQDVWVQIVTDVAGSPPVLGGWYWEVITPNSGTHKLTQVGAGTTYRSIDGTGWIFNATSCILTSEEGVQYGYNCTPPSQTIPYPIVNNLSYVQDTNGNKLQLNYSGPSVLSSYTDTMGQTIAVPPISLSAISFANNVGGQSTTNLTQCASTATSAIVWTPPGTSNQMKFCYSPVHIQTNFFDGAGAPDVPTLPDGKANWKNEAVSNKNWLTSVVMPDGMVWNFAYAPVSGTNVNYGNLTSIGMATGGTISYNWGEGFNTCAGPSEAYRSGLLSRSVDAADGNGPQTWNYAYTFGNGNASPATSELTTDPLGNTIKHTLTAITACSSYETEADYIDHKLGPVKTTKTQYEILPVFDSLGASTATAGALPTSVTTIWPDGSTRQTTYAYDQLSFVGIDWLSGTGTKIPYGMPTTQTESDFGSGSPGATLRQRNTAYMAFSGPNAASYLANNLLTLPYTVQIADGSGTQKALTTYGYDESGYVTNSGAYNGNLTTSTKWLNTGGTVASHNYYDSNGMTTKVVDTKNNATTYTYQCSDALPLQKINALGQTTMYSFNCNSRLLSSIQDPNDAAAGRAGTTYSYNAGNDLQQIAYPDNGITTFNYNNYALPLTLTKTVTATPDPSIVSSVTYDGLGRVASSTAPSGAVTATTYDAIGHVNSITNPYFTTVTSSTDGTTTYLIDQLGRKNLQTQPDGNIQKWVYSGKITTVTDESTNSWQLTSDGLGQLISVIEPNLAQTSYTYDTLSNLISVSQPGLSGETARNRGFGYDSLSRLTSSSNPETGTVSYSYLTNGALCAGATALPCVKTDARNITVSYGYDALNRMTGKSSSDGSVNYGYKYDGPVQGNGIGRLNQSFNNGANAATYYSYDAMGRLTGQSYCVPTNCSYGIGASASYDLAGNQTSQTYPDGRTITNAFDAAGRIYTIMYTNWGGNNHSTYYLGPNSSPEYDPTNHFINAALGNGVGIAASYDKRERIGMLAYGVATQLLWGKQYGWTPNSNLNTTTDILTGVQRQFGYDNLNRLTSAQDLVGSTQGTDPTPFPIGSGGSTGTTTGAIPSPLWTDPDESNELLSPDAPGAEGWHLQSVSTTAGVTAPDGTTSAFSFTGSASDSYLNDSVEQPSLYGGETMTGSVWLRAPGGAQAVDLFICGTNSSGFTCPGATQLNVTTNWQQYSISGQMPIGLTSLYLQIGGASTVHAGQTISVWGPMLEDSGTSSPTETNFLPNSQRLTASTWGGNTITASDNSAPAPDGTNTAAVVTASSGDSWLVDSVSNPAPYSSMKVTGSIWLCTTASGGQNIALTLIENGTPLGYTTVALTTAWQRFQITGTTQASLDELQLQIGGGTTFTTGQSVQAWGAQMELASSAGPYIATAALPVSQGTSLTNVLPYSQQPTAPSWSASSGTPNSVAAPDGSMTGYAMTATTSDSYITDDTPTPALYDGATVTGSIFLQAPGGSQSVAFYVVGENASGRTYLGTQVVQLTSTWQRFTYTGQLPNGLTRVFLQVGGGQTFTSGQSINIWGAQLEVAPTMGPYVVTTSLPVIAGKQLTNIFPNSQQLNGPSWYIANGSATPNNATAPDGTMTAATVTANSGSTDTDTDAFVPNPSLYDGLTVTGSIYLRVPNGSPNLTTGMFLINNGENGWQAINGQAITITTSWQRFDITGTNSNGLSELYLQIGEANTITSGLNIQVWGAQMVIGDSAAPYTPTTGTTTSPATSQPVTLIQNGLNQTYTYDSFGNLQQNGGFNDNFTANNQMFGYAYDASGNLLSNGLTTMNWDAESKMLSTGGATYIYDAEGNRVEKQGEGVTDTIYFGGRPIARYSAGGWIDLIYGPNGLMAEVGGTESALPNYRLLDHLGNQVGTTGVNGLFSDPLDYTPFGQVFSGSTNDPYMFTGKERDPESGLDEFGARYYGSSMGRFMSPDWSASASAVPYATMGNPQSLNLYAYVGNNPVSRTDPDGHAAQQWGDGSYDDGLLPSFNHGYGSLMPPPPNLHSGISSTLIMDDTSEGSGEYYSTDPAQQQNTNSTTTTVTLNSRSADIPGGQLLHDVGVNHEWISTPDGTDVGMGTAKGVPQSDAPGVQTQVVDHTGQVPTSTQTFTGVNKAALATYTQVGTPTGRWLPGVNDCNTWAHNAINQSTPHDISIVIYGVPTVIAHNAVVYADGSVH